MSNNLRSFLTASTLTLALGTNIAHANESVLPTEDFPVVGSVQNTKSTALKKELFPSLQACFSYYNLHYTDLKYKTNDDYKMSCIGPDEQISIEITHGYLTSVADLTTGEDKHTQFGATVTELRHY